MLIIICCSFSYLVGVGLVKVAGVVVACASYVCVDFGCCLGSVVFGGLGG